jgi:hypothetical protein
LALGVYPDTSLKQAREKRDTRQKTNSWRYQSKRDTKGGKDSEA